MANMGCCRFQNTKLDLKDVYYHMDDEDLSEDEAEARNKIVEIAKDIVEWAEENEDLLK